MSTKINYDQFEIVLCRTSHPGNIGSTARAIKTMGFSKLTLVNPKQFPHSEANALAAGAEDVLNNAKVVKTIEEALIDSHLIIGFTARQRELSQEHQNIRKIAKDLKNEPHQKKIALLFGNETNGLSNDEIKHCHKLGYINSNENYSSLNLAQAVQIICYEIRMHISEGDGIIKLIKENELVSHEIQNGFYVHLEQLLTEIGFLKKIQGERLMQRLRLLFNRTTMEKDEVNILRGILTDIQKKIKDKT
ncbi:MAG: RNA methyltransferase [Nitrosomonadales bacterium]|nr:RNA methyltransferase [Nitrosomonadales bacterium]